MSVVEVDLGATRASIPFDLERPAGDTPVRGAIAVAHGAGSGREQPLLVAFAQTLREAGLVTLRFDFAYRAAGRRMPGPAAHAIVAWSAVLRELRGAAPGVPIVAAGKSYGGRMASMAAAEGAIDPDALVYLGYPLHPPGKPESPRIAHLPGISAPQLFLAGTKDPFLQPLEQFEQAVASCQRAEIVWTDGGGHSFEVAGAKRSPDQIGRDLAAAVADRLVAAGVMPPAS